jgi:hypothetical protein
MCRNLLEQFKKHEKGGDGKRVKMTSFWKSNLAMEIHPCIDEFPLNAH